MQFVEMLDMCTKAHEAYYKKYYIMDENDPLSE